MRFKLYGRTTSYNVQKVLWLLEELSLEFDHIECGGRFGGLDSDEFLSLNPFGKVPLLVDQGKTIRESNSILRYLAATSGNTQWWPEDAYQRAQYEAWMDWSIDHLEAAFVGVFWGYYRTPEPKRDWSHINQSKDKTLQCLSMLNNQLEEKEFLSGNSISLADITVGVFMYRFAEIDLDFEFPPQIQRWYENLQTRSGYQQYVMSDFSELKGREDY